MLDTIIRNLHINPIPDNTTDWSWYVNRENNTTVGQPHSLAQHNTALALTEESRAADLRTLGNL